MNIYYHIVRDRDYERYKKNKLIDEGSELYEKIGQLKLKSLKDGKM